MNMEELHRSFTMANILEISESGTGKKKTAGGGMLNGQTPVRSPAAADEADLKVKVTKVGLLSRKGGPCP
jgi:hypothetical protein